MKLVLMWLLGVPALIASMVIISVLQPMGGLYRHPGISVHRALVSETSITTKPASVDSQTD